MPKLIYIKRADTREDRLKDLIRRIQDEDKVATARSPMLPSSRS